MTEIRIRPADPGDAREIARLANALSLHEGRPGDVYTEAIVLRDGFGDNPAFCVLVAERDGGLVGYASYQDFYNSDIATRGLWLTDLYVGETARRQGAGSALMAALAHAAVARGAASIWLGVSASNARALAFYSALGADDDEGRILEFNGPALEALAGAAPVKG